MKKMIVSLSLGVLLSIGLSSFVFADVEIKKDVVADGVLGIKYTGDLDKGIKAMVEKDGVRYTYTIKDNKLNYVPLQMGTGSYKVSVLENMQGNTYLPLSSEDIKVASISPTKGYTYPTLITYYTNSMKSISYYKNQTSTKSTADKIKFIYEDITNNYYYDQAKISSLPKEYVPYIDDMFEKKKGICYDYAALLSGALRSQNIPTKLVMGYAPEIKEYHSWNEVYIDGKWNVVDTTYDAAMVHAGRSVSFAKDPSKFKVLKVY